MNFHDYQQIDAHNPSSVKHARDSMLAYRWHMDNPREAPTPAMIFGSAVHCSVLEPDEFAVRYAVWDGDRRGKAYKDFVAANAGRVPLNTKEYRACLACRNSVRNHPAAGPILAAGGDVEAVLQWIDKETGLPCKGRVDLNQERVVDLKTIRAIDDRTIARELIDYGYHISMAAYQDGICTTTGEIKDCVLIFVETRPPYDCRVKVLSSDALQQGYEEWVGLLRKIKACTESGHWPGVAETEETLELPAWAVSEPELTIGGSALEL